MNASKTLLQMADNVKTFSDIRRILHDTRSCLINKEISAADAETISKLVSEIMKETITRKDKP